MTPKGQFHLHVYKKSFLLVKIQKVQKDSQVIGVFLRFMDLHHRP